MNHEQDKQKTMNALSECASINPEAFASLKNARLDNVHVIIGRHSRYHPNVSVLLAAAGIAASNLPLDIYPKSITGMWFDELEKLDISALNAVPSITDKEKAHQRAVNILGPRKGRWK